MFKLVYRNLSSHWVRLHNSNSGRAPAPTIAQERALCSLAVHCSEKHNMKPFTFASTKALAVEFGGASKLAAHLAPLNARRPLVVTDPGIAKAGLLDGAMASLRAAGVDACVYSDTVADPPESLVLQATAVAHDHGADSIVGFGGGSSMDIAKLVAVLAEPSCSQPLAEMYGVGNVHGVRLPLVQVPTTAGTGSEVTPISIITLGAEQKAGVVSPQLLPDVALLDGELTASLPGHVAAATGVDAMVHAIEAYTSTIRKNPLSDLLAREALKLLSANIHAVSGSGGGRVASAEARSAMLLGSSCCPLGDGRTRYALRGRQTLRNALATYVRPTKR